MKRRGRSVQWEITLFWFMLIALVAVVTAVALVALRTGGGLPEVESDRLAHPLPLDRPMHRADIDALRLPMAVRGYRMAEVDDVLDRVAAELAHRDAKLGELEARLAERCAVASEPALAKRVPGESEGEKKSQDAISPGSGDDGPPR